MQKILKYILIITGWLKTNMTRVENLLDVQVEETLDAVVKGIEELKLKQTMGSDSIIPKINTTGNDFDMDAITEGFGGYFMNLNITFTAEHQKNPYAFAAIELYDMDGTPLDAGGVEGTIYSTKVHKDDGIEEIHVSIHNIIEGGSYVTNFPFKVKVLIFASDDGTVEIEEVSGI
jgi:hypothetical protein